MSRCGGSRRQGVAGARLRMGIGREWHRVRRVLLARGSVGWRQQRFTRKRDVADAIWQAWEDGCGATDGQIEGRELG